MSTKTKHEKIIVSFAGPADEALLNFIIKKIENSNLASRKTKPKLCITAIELINNVITHGYRSAFCIFNLEKSGRGFEMTCGNFFSDKNVTYIKSRIKETAKQKDLETFYYSLLRNSKPGTSGKLGIVRMYKISEGNFDITKEKLNGKTFGKISLKIRNHA